MANSPRAFLHSWRTQGTGATRRGRARLPAWYGVSQRSSQGMREGRRRLGDLAGTTRSLAQVLFRLNCSGLRSPRRRMKSGLPVRPNARLGHVQGRENGNQCGEDLGLYRGGLHALWGSKSRPNRDLIRSVAFEQCPARTRRREGGRCTANMWAQHVSEIETRADSSYTEKEGGRGRVQGSLQLGWPLGRWERGEFWGRSGQNRERESSFSFFPFFFLLFKSHFKSIFKIYLKYF